MGQVIGPKSKILRGKEALTLTRHTIHQVREILTIVTEDRTFQICPVEVLLRRHPPQAVVAFLEMLRKDYRRELGAILRQNKLHPKIDYLIALIFRLKMAINTIRNAEKRGEKADPPAVEAHWINFDDMRMRFHLPPIEHLIRQVASPKQAPSTPEVNHSTQKFSD